MCREEEDEEEDVQLSFGGKRDGVEGRNLAETIPDNEEKRRRVEGARGDLEIEGGGGDGTLVLHVRSGDIFDNEVLAYYGQVRTYCAANSSLGFVAPLFLQQVVLYSP